MIQIFRHWILILLAGLFAGCALVPSPQNHFSRPADLFPADGLLIQRALLTVHGRQFALNGYVALSATGGRRLIVTETFGGVMADLLVKPDGKVFLMQASRVFPEKYVRRFVTADLKCIFGDVADKNCPVTMLDKNHFVIDRGYKLDLRTVEVKRGAQPPELFDETKAVKK